MVKSKNKKSVIALVVMAFLLVASICLAATGAWFTDKVSDGNGTVKFGKINIEYGTPFSISDAAAVKMPGDTVTVNGTISNAEEAAYVALDISVTIDGKAEALQSVKKVVAVDKGATLDLQDHIGTNGNFVLNGDDYDNTFQGKAITVTVKICAVQQKNVTLTDMNATGYDEVVAYVTTNAEVQGPQGA